MKDKENSLEAVEKNSMLSINTNNLNYIICFIRNHRSQKKEVAQFSSAERTLNPELYIQQK